DWEARIRAELQPALRDGRPDDHPGRKARRGDLPNRISGHALRRGDLGEPQYPWANLLRQPGGGDPWRWEVPGPGTFRSADDSDGGLVRHLLLHRARLRAGLHAVDHRAVERWERPVSGRVGACEPPCARRTEG